LRNGEKMLVEVLGTGCTKCKQLYKIVDETLQQAGITAELRKVEDLRTIMDRGVMMTPALVIDGKTVSAGRLPKKEELLALLQGGQ